MERTDGKGIARLLGRVRSSLPNGRAQQAFDAVAGMLDAYSKAAERSNEKYRVSLVEKRAMGRKLAQRRDVVIWDTLTLPEVAEIVRLDREGVGAARIAALFEIPTADVRTILRSMSGKEAGFVLFSAELRRQRRERVTALVEPGETVGPAETETPEAETEAETGAGAEEATEIATLQHVALSPGN